MISQVLEVMTQLARERMTMVVVTRDMGFARELGTTVDFMGAERIVEVAPPAPFFAAAREARARRFLSQVLPARA